MKNILNTVFFSKRYILCYVFVFTICTLFFYNYFLTYSISNIKSPTIHEFRTKSSFTELITKNKNLTINKNANISHTSTVMDKITTLMIYSKHETLNKIENENSPNETASKHFCSFVISNKTSKYI